MRKINKAARFNELYSHAVTFDMDYTQSNLRAAAPGIYRVEDSEDGAHRLLFCTQLGACIVHSKGNVVTKTTTEPKLADLIYSVLPINMGEADFILGCKNGLGHFVENVQSLMKSELGV